METQQEIWESLARPEYPNLSRSEMAEFKIHSAMDWCMDEDTPGAKLYDKFVMMRNLMDVSWNDK